MQKLRRLFSIPVKQNQLGRLRRELAIERLRAMELHAFVDAWLAQAHDSVFDARLQELIDAQWSALEAHLAIGVRRVKPLIARRKPSVREENNQTDDAEPRRYPTSRWHIEFDR